ELSKSRRALRSSPEIPPSPRSGSNKPPNRFGRSGRDDGVGIVGGGDPVGGAGSDPGSVEPPGIGLGPPGGPPPGGGIGGPPGGPPPGGIGGIPPGWAGGLPGSSGFF